MVSPCDCSNEIDDIDDFGVTGMTIASQTHRDYDVTNMDEHFAGDDYKEWSSPWAGANWVDEHPFCLREQEIQLKGVRTRRN